jgi:YebC/PmpR family DNA-binding regulatory protein
MSGHSKWSTIKHKKGAADAKRGKVFTRIIKEMTVAARLGGGDIEGNPRLRAAVAEAKASNMPKDNIERAIKRGTGEIEGAAYEEFTYEGYGPGGVAIIVEALTDNANRTTPEIRNIFEKNGGNLGTPGSVKFQFDKKGYFAVEKSAVAEDRLMEVALEAGADDLQSDDADAFEIYTTPENFEAVRHDPVDVCRRRRAEVKTDHAPSRDARRSRRYPERLVELRHPGRDDGDGVGSD